MEDMESKLGKILSDPGAMQQIMALAQALGSSNQPQPQQSSQPAQQSPPSSPGPQLPAARTQGADNEALLKMLFEFSKNTKDDPRQLALFQALKPFLRPERAAKIDRALQAARISRAAGTALERFAPNLFSGR